MDSGFLTRVFILLTFVFGSLAHTAYATGLSPSAKEFESMMTLNFAAFDQTLPNGGWRGVKDSFEAAKMLDVYNLHHTEKLSEDEKRILYWHAGQSYATAGLYQLAIARFEKSYDPTEKPNSEFKWNAYVKGSIAFLKKDLKTLIAARDQLRAADQGKPSPNRKVLESFVRCFKKTYEEAYSSDCK